MSTNELVLNFFFAGVVLNFVYLRLSPGDPLRASAKIAHMQTFPSRKGGAAAAVLRFPSCITGGSWLRARWRRRRRSLGKEVAAGEEGGHARVPELRARRPRMKEPTPPLDALS
jgi:hypothetical protein